MGKDFPKSIDEESAGISGKIDAAVVVNGEYFIHTHITGLIHCQSL